MSLPFSRVYHGQPSTTVAVIGSAATQATMLIEALAANPTNVPLDFQLDLLPGGASGLTQDGTHAIVPRQSIPARQSIPFQFKTVMAIGDALAAYSQSVPPPYGVTATGSSSGGTLAATTYYYVVTATNTNGESARSGEVNVTTSGSTSSVVLAWRQVLGATGYKVYRSTASGSEQLLATVSAGATVTYTDTGSAASGANAPTIGAAGTAGGIVLTVSGLVG